MQAILFCYVSLLAQFLSVFAVLSLPVSSLMPPQRQQVIFYSNGFKFCTANAPWCSTLSLDFEASHNDCVPAMKYGNLAAITVCLHETQLSITGYQFDSDKVMIYSDFILQIDVKNINGNFSKFVLTNLDVWNSDVMVKFKSNVEVYNCIIRGTTFRYITNLSFYGCLFKPIESFSISTNIQKLTFQNCLFSTIFAQVPSIVMSFYRCQQLTFNECAIENDILVELSITLYGSNKVLFNDCKFSSMIGHNFTYSSYKQRTILYVSSGEIEFHRCRMQGKYEILIYQPLSVEIIDSQFNSISTSNDLLSILVDTVDANTTIRNTVFKNINCLHSVISMFDDLSTSSILNLFNVSFENNIGTPVISDNVRMNFHNVSFLNNSGMYAGAVFIGISLSGMAEMILKNTRMRNNTYTYEYGGDVCFQITKEQNIGLNLVMRAENTSNMTVFFDLRTSQLQKLSNTSSIRDFSSTKYLRTSPRYIDTDHLFHGSDVFPGKTIFLSGCISVTDYFHNDASCKANPSLHYDHNEDNCTIQLASNDKIQLKTGKEMMSSVYVIATSVDCLEIKGKEITLLMACDDVTTSVTLILRGCPLGYIPSNNTDQNGQPLLTCEVADEGHLIETDDSKQHIACIDRDYWYGQVNIRSNHPIKVYCGPPYCVQNTEACSLAGYTDTHQKLPWTQDEQCSGLYGGVLCRSCQEDAVFTFGASKCISLNDCKEWQPYLIICLAIVGQIALSLVMICSRAKTTVGVGYLYGPLFFIAVYKLLPISNSYLQKTSPLEYALSLFETVLLLDLDILGKVNWCMFNNINKTLLYSMRFLGPLVTFMVLLVIVLIARSNFCFKFKINRIIQSPIQPMCLLIILSFWSLSKTSIEIIKPIIINGEWRFAIQPEYNYLGNDYIIGLFSISVALLMCFYFPFIFFLFSSQFIRHKINLFRIQPFLDAFQSSYKDKYQWFSGVYLFSWLVLNTELPPYAFVIAITGVSVLQFTLHPHKSKFLNITDNLLLADIIIMSSLSYMRYEDRAVMESNIHC